MGAVGQDIVGYELFILFLTFPSTSELQHKAIPAEQEWLCVIHYFFNSSIE